MLCLSTIYSKIDIFRGRPFAVFKFFRKLVAVVRIVYINFE